MFIPHRTRRQTNTIDKTCEQRGTFIYNRDYKETYTYNPKETSEISGNMTRKEGLENLTLTGPNEEQRPKWKWTKLRVLFVNGWKMDDKGER